MAPDWPLIGLRRAGSPPGSRLKHLLLARPEQGLPAARTTGRLGSSLSERPAGSPGLLVRREQADRAGNPGPLCYTSPVRVTRQLSPRVIQVAPESRARRSHLSDVDRELREPSWHLEHSD